MKVEIEIPDELVSVFVDTLDTLKEGLIETKKTAKKEFKTAEIELGDIFSGYTELFEEMFGNTPKPKKTAETTSSEYVSVSPLFADLLKTMFDGKPISNGEQKRQTEGQNTPEVDQRSIHGFPERNSVRMRNLKIRVQGLASKIRYIDETASMHFFGETVQEVLDDVMLNNIDKETDGVLIRYMMRDYDITFWEYIADRVEGK